MPTYEYYCEENDTSVEVIHSMSEELTTWGELCDCAEIDHGDTPKQTGIIRKLSAISLLAQKGESNSGGGGCCGGGCGGH
jgi:hypothetical protein